MERWAFHYCFLIKTVQPFLCLCFKKICQSLFLWLFTGEKKSEINDEEILASPFCDDDCKELNTHLIN